MSGTVVVMVCVLVVCFLVGMGFFVFTETKPVFDYEGVLTGYQQGGGYYTYFFDDGLVVFCGRNDEIPDRLWIGHRYKLGTRMYNGGKINVMREAGERQQLEGKR